jgi:transposase
MPGDRSFQLIEAVADRIEGAPVAGRRRWSDAFKAEMAARSCEPGANVSALAREIGISPSQLFGWRSVLVRKGAIERRDAAGCGVSCEPQRAPSRVIEIDVNGMTVRADADVDEAHLRRVLRTVRSA